MMRYLARLLGYHLQVAGERIWDWGFRPSFAAHQRDEADDEL